MSQKVKRGDSSNFPHKISEFHIFACNAGDKSGVNTN